MKFPADRFPAGLFDLSQDTVRSLPVELIERWTQSDQSIATARQLLDPVRVECGVVCTDASGLTQLTRMRGLIEMLAVIDHPKELVHAWGAAVGGAATGIWAADNTQMFYPPAVPANAVLSMLLSLMGDVAQNCEVSIGAAAHWGSFFLLADGLYGAEAERVEYLAEEFARPGEVLITPEFAARLSADHPFALRPKDGLPANLAPAFLVENGPYAEGLEPNDVLYPIPFSADFYHALKDWYRAGASPADLDSIRRRYCQTRAVVLIERERAESTVSEINVLNDLALSAAMLHLATELLPDTGGSVAKIAGPVGIFTFPDCGPAIGFARRFRDAFLQRGIQSRAAVDVGELLVFELGGGLIDVAGMPVNVASKLAQDRGEFGRIYLTDSAVVSCMPRDHLSAIKVRFGNVVVNAWVE